MNHANFSPGQPNEAAGRKVTPSSRNSDAAEGTSNSIASGGDTTNSTKKQSVSSRFLIGEDLQKIRHSSHRNRSQRETEELEGEDDDMDNSDHDNVIKDLLYPALEEGSSRSRQMQLDFFEDDYQAAQTAMNSSGTTATTAASTFRSSFQSSTTSINDSFRDSSIRSSMAFNPEPGQNPNDSASFSNSASNSAYLNALRRRSTNDTFDPSMEKNRR
jgi:hypothetical protein